MIHYHAYSWAGSAEARNKASERHPAAGALFANSKIPPEVVRDNLRRPASAVEQTFTDPAAAAAWLVEKYKANPPSGPDNPLSPADKERFATARLSNSNDAVIGHYNGMTFVSASVVCCPSDGYPCPAPPG
jgi:hypothetical protein